MRPQRTPKPAQVTEPAHSGEPDDGRRFMRELHDRTPALITPERLGRWLAHDTPPEVAAQLLVPRNDLVMHRVSKRLN